MYNLYFNSHVLPTSPYEENLRYLLLTPLVVRPAVPRESEFGLRSVARSRVSFIWFVRGPIMEDERRRYRGRKPSIIPRDSGIDAFGIHKG